MDQKNGTHDKLLDNLREREKELNCLYMVDEYISNDEFSPSEVFTGIVSVLPLGWRFPDLCRAKIVYNNKSYQTPGFIESPLCEACEIMADGKSVGTIEIVYIREVPGTEEGYFLEKERKLIRTVAERIGRMIVYRQMKSVVNHWEIKQPGSPGGSGTGEWKLIVDYFRHSDHGILLHLCRKLINYMLISGVKEASSILNDHDIARNEDDHYANSPMLSEPIDDIVSISERAFSLAEKYINDRELTAQIKKWIVEESAYSLVKSIGCIHPSLEQIIEELDRFRRVSRGENLIYTPKGRWLSVSLISLILSDKPDFINIAKKYINYRDFFDLCGRIIHPAESQGRLGGKGTGLFLAQKILEKESKSSNLHELIRIPKTWYITTDTMTDFLHYNSLEELDEQKYKDLQEIRMEYPNIIQLMKNFNFPPNIMKSLSVALDDFGNTPLIVRSSSILEDQVGAAFSGKYKSLFLANQGSKTKRLEALKNAIIEVYASVFSSDPIQYRLERGLLDFREEMGILIQEVVGNQVGKYFFPLFSGVAFSNNEYRWSPRIRREDGLIRMVPGLGTRAVDRLTDDFPVMVSPDQPGIRVNNIPEEKKRYSPKKIDVINLEKNTFETVAITDLLKEYGMQISMIDKIVSVMEYDLIRNTNSFDIHFDKDDLVVTFDGVILQTPFIRTVGTILKILRQRLGYPVDLEFACDGKNIYLLQCRPQSSGTDCAPAPIPQDIPGRDIIFSANRYISNGLIQDISHIVYVDPDGYAGLQTLEQMKTVGRIVGLLNCVLPKRRFILVGPGRWGSRGDIKLGVPVSYSDICNTAALVEIARKKAGYIPELSFGTHFFQDLVEANIRVLPLYPDDAGIVFNERYLSKTENSLSSLLPEYSGYEDVVRVIHVSRVSPGYTLCIAMNAELSEALAFLTQHRIRLPRKTRSVEYEDFYGDDIAWRWRHHMAEQIALQMDTGLFGVKGVYLFGSTANGTAGPGSDIDLLIHFEGDEQQKKDLNRWLDGWSRSLAEINFMKAGYRMSKMLDVHIVTDEDIRNKDSFAMKINDTAEPAIRLQTKN